METIAKHPGIVAAVADGQVQVSIRQASGCAGCAARSKCGFTEEKEKLINIATPDWESYRVGETVTVSVGARRGLKAVLIAYILPAALVLAVLAVLHYGHLSDLWSALAALGAIGLYCVVLYLLRHRIQRDFQFGIQHSPVH